MERESHNSQVVEKDNPRYLTVLLHNYTNFRDNNISIIMYLTLFQAFDRINGYLEHAKSSPNLKVIAGGNADKRYGHTPAISNVVYFLVYSDFNI